jgi:hypothetical protein
LADKHSPKTPSPKAQDAEAVETKDNNQADQVPALEKRIKDLEAENKRLKLLSE